ncbi:MAG: lysine exporter LysO family protein [Deferribacteraceae bacterium]|jgi:uncharacterized membrane protein YbjE (DUF340 family)|nr:lysine exporter LysO family protein [Deferribacteraceae bacterium]
MLIAMFASMVLGLVSSYLGILPASFEPIANDMPYYCLCFMLFLVGYGISKDREVLKQLFKRNLYAILIPIGTISGTLAGGALASIFLPLGLRESMAVAAGCGWYSYSAVYLAEVHSADLGAVAFLANVGRETVALFTIPLIVKVFGKYSAISVAGATSMDVTMPIVSRYAGSEAAILSFIHGVVVSIVVPFLVPILIGW